MSLSKTFWQQLFYYSKPKCGIPPYLRIVEFSQITNLEKRCPYGASRVPNDSIVLVSVLGALGFSHKSSEVNVQ
jgi:hypothetical protein